jgi:hypothetical protein
MDDTIDQNGLINKNCGGKNGCSTLLFFIAGMAEIMQYDESHCRAAASRHGGG